MNEERILHIAQKEHKSKEKSKETLKEKEKKNWVVESMMIGLVNRFEILRLHCPSSGSGLWITIAQKSLQLLESTTLLPPTFFY